MNEHLDHSHSQPRQLIAAFLVRCWREGEQWRYLLEDVNTKERKGFSSVETLCLFLEGYIGEKAVSEQEKESVGDDY